MNRTRCSSQNPTWPDVICEHAAEPEHDEHDAIALGGTWLRWTDESKYGIRTTTIDAFRKDVTE